MSNSTLSPTELIQVPISFLAQIADNSNHIPRLYYARNPLLRRMFWERLHILNRMLNRHLQHKESCVDFGGGSGVLLPTLAAKFNHLTLVDLETKQATLVKQRYDLQNVTIVQGDIACLDLGATRFDAAIAADVLEHFRDLNLPVNVLRRWLKPGGLLFTSLPTENRLYCGLRKVFGIEKPMDHYHTANEVEAFLDKSGFQRIATSPMPWSVPFMPLFLITAWRST
ncbi:MAG: ubiG [Verrucomicrobiales bacterium]|nr:ubiG [Verrucomicrobiales bacterium]